MITGIKGPSCTISAFKRRRVCIHAIGAKPLIQFGDVDISSIDGQEQGGWGDCDADSRQKRVICLNVGLLNCWMNIMKMMIFFVEFEGFEGGGYG